MAGLSSANVIPAESMEGITPHIVKCIPPSFLQVRKSFKAPIRLPLFIRVEEIIKIRSSHQLFRVFYEDHV